MGIYHQTSVATLINDMGDQQKPLVYDNINTLPCTVPRMKYSYRCWADFGSQGSSPTQITLDYHPTRDYTLSEEATEAITKTWEALSDRDGKLFDAPGFNLRGVTDFRLRLGPTRFRDHRVRRALLSGEDCVRGGYSESVTKELEDTVHLLSSFVAIVADDRICLGLKPDGPTNAPFLSLPGSGYLDREVDMMGKDVESTKRVIGREIREEINFDIDDATVRCLGVYEDTDSDSHLNPALFSVVETEQTPDTVRKRAQTAPDRDEFIDLTFVPAEGAVLSSLVARALPGKSQNSLPESYPFDDVGRMSHKTLLMLLLLGRYFNGAAWFDDQWTRFDACTFESNGNDE